MKVYLRDDDLCFYTEYKKFRELYDELGIPVSISLIPYAVPNHANDTMPFGEHPKNVEQCIFDNDCLCKHLKQDIKEGKCSILLHGYSHEYKKEGDKYIAEMKWKPLERIEKEITKVKRELEEYFEVNINTFVAPSNEITKEVVDLVAKLGMDYSGTIGWFDRSLSCCSIKNFIKRWWTRLRYKVALGGVMKYKDHNELGVIPITTLDEFIRIFKICRKHNWDLCLVTHYWELDGDKDKIKTLKNIVNFLENNNTSFVLLEEIK